MRQRLWCVEMGTDIMQPGLVCRDAVGKTEQPTKCDPVNWAGMCFAKQTIQLRFD